MTIIKYYITPAVDCRRAQKYNCELTRHSKHSFITSQRLSAAELHFPFQRGIAENTRWLIQIPSQRRWQFIRSRCSYAPRGVCGVSFFFWFCCWAPFFSPAVGAADSGAGSSRRPRRASLRAAGRRTMSRWVPGARRLYAGKTHRGLKRLLRVRGTCNTFLLWFTIVHTGLHTFHYFCRLLFIFCLKASCKPLKKRLNFSNIYVKLTKK